MEKNSYNTSFFALMVIWRVESYSSADSPKESPSLSSLMSLSPLKAWTAPYESPKKFKITTKNTK